MSEFNTVPFRPLEDFVGGEARFQATNFQDLDKWANRVLNNLLYYQTNYLVAMAVIFLLVGMFDPTNLLVGMIATLSTLALINYLAKHQSAAAGLKRRHPCLCLSLMLVGGYLLTSLLGSVMVFLFGIALPILCVFVHASLRLRNLKSKVFNKAESLGVIKTPMGFVLEQLGETFENISG